MLEARVAVPRKLVVMTLRIATVLATLVSGAALARWVKAPPYDDPFITFRYAANLRQGHGLVFNPGEQLLSTTTPLFALLLGALGTFLPGWDVAALGYWLSLATLVVAGALASAICWREGETAAGSVAPLTVVLAPSVFLTVGQEAGLLLALGFGSFYLWRARQLTWSAVALGLLALTRPDGVLLGGILLVAEVWRSRRLPLLAGGVFALVIAPWYLYAWAAYGSPFPFSLAAKAAQAQTGWWPTTETALWDWLRASVEQSPVAWGLAFVGVAYAARFGRWALLLLWWPISQLAGYSLLGVASYPWYFAPLHGVVGLLTALGASALPRVARQLGWRDSAVAAVLFAAVSLTLLVPSVLHVREIGRHVPDPKMRQYEAIGTWLRERVGPEALVAALEMGRLGYFGGTSMFDFVGLVRPPVVEHLREKDLMWSVRTYQPDYVVAIPTDDWLLGDGWFQSTYAPLRHFARPDLDSGQPTTVFARTTGDPPARSSDQAIVHRFDDRIVLVGYDVAPSPQEPEGKIYVLLHWRALKPINKDYTVYVHALGEDGHIVGQADGQPLGGRRPTSRWTTGETVLDPREIRLEPGQRSRSLRVGWYLLETMGRLPGVDAIGQEADAAVIVLDSAR